MYSECTGQASALLVLLPKKRKLKNILKFKILLKINKILVKYYLYII